MPKAGYAPLNADGIRSYLQALPVARERLGHDHAKWRVREVGDGNLNLVFIVEGAGAVVVKQALPYVRLVGESWPLPLKRSFFESNALSHSGEICPGADATDLPFR